MELFKWNDRFLTGIGSVDAEHQRLVSLLNRAAAAAEAGATRDRAEVESLFEELVDYARTHFANEERVMLEGGCLLELCIRHRAEHATFLDQIRLLRSASESPGGSQEGLVALLRFLSGWLAHHILGADQAMARQLQAIRKGRHPEDVAQEFHVPEAAATTALLDGLGNVMRLLAERNRALAEAQARLEETNRALEERVSVRTRELEETHDRLLQSEKLASVGLLAGGVAHEVNNPLASTTSNVGTLGGYLRGLLSLVEAYEAAEDRLPQGMREALAQKKAEVDLAEIRADAHVLVADTREGLGRMARIAHDLKAFSRNADGEWTVSDVHGCLEEGLRWRMPDVPESVEIVRRFSELPPVSCLCAQLGFGFASLVGNAVEAIPPGTRGRVTLESGLQGEEIWVSVTDTGVGMSPEVQRRLFEPFFTTRGGGRGTGLGLSVAWGIVQSHRGRIEVTSAPGQGSCFRVFLPLRRAESGPEAAQRERTG